MEQTPIPTDYATSGLSIQQAMLAEARFRKPTGFSPKIRWGGKLVQTSDTFAVPVEGRFRLKLVSAVDNWVQGVDVAVSGGIRLADGNELPTLRTWMSPEYEDEVGYSYTSPDGKMTLWNVYQIRRPDGTVDTLKWTGNAGFWVEEGRRGTRVYHCSPGPLDAPNFDALTFQISIGDG
jgi:hypothetical protein